MTVHTPTERQFEILCLIIEIYLETGEAVSSRSLSKHKSINLSPASLRNIMADITEFNYIEQQHTSGGRVPTDTGYRLYVNCMTQRKKLKRSETKWVKAIYQKLKKTSPQLDSLLKQTTEFLTNMTNLPSLATAPQPENLRMRHIQFMHHSQNQVLVVLITKSGLVTHKLLPTKENLDIKFLMQLGEYITSQFVGEKLTEIQEKLLVSSIAMLKTPRHQLANAIRLSKKALELPPQNKLYTFGQIKILDYAELSDPTCIQYFYQLLEDKTKILRSLEQVNEQTGVQVLIGSENSCKELNPYSIVTATYGAQNNRLGRLGVIGPKRMDYSKVSQIIQTTVDSLNSELDHLNER